MNINWHSKRIKVALRFLNYALIAFMTVTTTTVLIYMAKGYRFDRKTGHIVQNGLLMIDAAPVKAVTKIDGKVTSTTPGRYILPAGEYQISLTADGYRTWSKTIHLDGSAVEWVHYPRLFPNDIETVPAMSFTEPELVSSSQNSKFLLQRTKGDTTNLATVYQLSNINKSIVIPWPKSQLALGGKKDAGTFSVVEWALDNKHVLMKRVLGKNIEYLSVDVTKPSAVVNLTKLFGGAISEPHFLANDANSLYAISKGNLYLYSAKTPKTPKLLLKNIQTYEPYGSDMILYAAGAPGQATQVGIMNKSTRTTVESVPYKQGRKYLLGYREYSGDQFFVVARSDSPKVNIYKNPLNHDQSQPWRTDATMSLPDPQYLSFSSSGQFASLQSGQRFAVYDFDNMREHIYTSSLGIRGEKASWMDGGHLLINVGGKVYVWDFDGTNLQLLGDSLQPFPVIFDADYTQMWTTGKSSVGNKVDFRLSSLVADKLPQDLLPAKQ